MTEQREIYSLDVPTYFILEAQPPAGFAFPASQTGSLKPEPKGFALPKKFGK
jgi:hypothetical protein